MVVVVVVVVVWNHSQQESKDILPTETCFSNMPKTGVSPKNAVKQNQNQCWVC